MAIRLDLIESKKEFQFVVGKIGEKAEIIHKLSLHGVKFVEEQEVKFQAWSPSMPNLTLLCYFTMNASINLHFPVPQVSLKFSLFPTRNRNTDIG